MGIGIDGPAVNGLAVISDSLLSTVDAEQSVAEVVVGLGESGIVGDGGLVAGNGLGMAAEFAEGDAEVIMRFAEGGSERNGPLVVLDALLHMSCFDQRQAEVGLPARIVRHGSDDGACQRHRGVEVAVAVQGLPAKGR